MNIKMNIENKNKLDKEITDYWIQEEQGVFRYLKFKIRNVCDYQIEDIKSDIFLKLYERLLTGKYPRQNWDALLRKIRNGCKVDFYRAEKKRQKRISKPKSEELESFRDPIKQDITKEKYEKDRLEKRKAVFIKKILLSQHRPLQEIMLIYRAPSLEILKEKINNRFPSIVRRVHRAGIHFEIIRKYEESSRNDKPLTKEELKEMGEFHNLLLKLANELKLNDYIGIESLKILLLSKDPFFDWYLVSKYPKTKDYRSFGKNGRVVKKKTIKRPYTYFFRDYAAIDSGTKGINKFIEDSTEIYPDYPVDRNYVKNRLGIKNLNSGAINKQKFGRTNTLGFKEKIKKYDTILKTTIKNL